MNPQISGYPMKKASDWIRPDWVDAEAWQQYEQHRATLKKNPFSDQARTLAANKLRGLSAEAQRETVNRTVESGWIALYPQKQLAEMEQREYQSAKKIPEEEWRRRQKIAGDKLRELRRKIAKVP